MRLPRSFVWLAATGPAMLIGAVGPWAYAGGRQLNGASHGRDGWFVFGVSIAAGLFLLLFLRLRNRLLALGPLIAGAVGIAVAANDIVDVESFGAHATTGWAIWATLVGSANVALASLVLLFEAPRAPVAEPPPVSRDAEFRTPDKLAEELEEPPQRTGGDYAPSVAERFSLYQRAGGIVVPLVTTLVAFLIGGIVIAATHLDHPISDTYKSYKGIFKGTGLIWLFPWVAGQERANAAFDLQQTLLLTTVLILTGFAVSFAFRCGLFNIGGNGQYIAGATLAVWVGSRLVDMNPALHVILAILAATAGGAAWAAIAGWLKATRGVHEVISTIMLNWIAVWTVSYLLSQGGPLQQHISPSVPISNDIAPGAHLPVFWGSPVLAGLHIGFFIALAMPVVFWLILNRTTLGYEVRAVGFNSEAARYGGINVSRSFVFAMAISGAFAGLAGAMDILGWQFRFGQIDVGIVNIGFVGIAVALLGRNSAIGVPLGALLFGGLVQGTSTRNPAIQQVFDPSLAGNLSGIIQGLVLLFVGADLLILYVWNLRKRLRRSEPAPPREVAEPA